MLNFLLKMVPIPHMTRGQRPHKRAHFLKVSLKFFFLKRGLYLGPGMNIELKKNSIHPVIKTTPDAALAH